MSAALVVVLCEKPSLGIRGSLQLSSLAINMLSKYGSPSISKDVDQGKFKTLAQRVEDILTNDILFHEPKQLDLSWILASPLNRDGAPPNVQHIHYKILRGCG